MIKAIDKIIINKETTIIDALRVVDQAALQIALVLDENRELLGTVTDGDIRRGILNGFNLNDSVSNVMFKTPFVVFEDEPIKSVISMALERKFHQVPVCNEKREVIGIYMIDELLKRKIKSNLVVLMVGGLGSRLKPLTDDIPKPMLKVGDRPILETIIRQFSKYGFKNIVLCVNYKAKTIEEYFKDGSDFDVNIEYIYEDKKLGTAGALSLLKNRPKEPFFVMNGDLLTNINFSTLLDYHKANESVATMGVREHNYKVPYGVVSTNGMDIKQIEEKPTYKFYVSGGIYVLEPLCLEYIPKNQYHDMPTLFEEMIDTNFKTITYPIKNYWLDIGHKDDYIKANEDYNRVFSE